MNRWTPCVKRSPSDSRRLTSISKSLTEEVAVEASLDWSPCCCEPARTGKRSRTSRYPDYIDDAEMVLADLETRLPDNTKLLHSIASIARLKNDVPTAEACYRRILEIDADDRIAYFNLGYLHSEKGGRHGGEEE